MKEELFKGYNKILKKMATTGLSSFQGIRSIVYSFGRSPNKGKTL